MDNRPAIRKYLDEVFPQRPGMAAAMRRDFAFRALDAEVSDEASYNARDGNGRQVLASVLGRTIRLTTFDQVGDDESRLDEVESVWLTGFVDATLRRRRLADRDHQPVVVLEFDHERLPGGGLRFNVDAQGDEPMQRTTALTSALAALMTHPCNGDSPHVALAQEPSR